MGVEKGKARLGGKRRKTREKLRKGRREESRKTGQKGKKGWDDGVEREKERKGRRQKGAMGGNGAETANESTRKASAKGE